MIAAGYGMYKREVEIYRELSPELELAPHSHYGAVDEETYDFVVIIDDLGHLRSTDQVQGCSVDDARHIVTAVAKHHAQWWNSERLATLPYIQSAGAALAPVQRPELQVVLARHRGTVRRTGARADREDLRALVRLRPGDDGGLGRSSGHAVPRRHAPRQHLLQ